MTRDTDHGSLSTLAAVLGFTSEDLEANRAGQLSPAQQEELGQLVAYHRNAWERSWGWLDPTAKTRRLRALSLTTSSLVFVIAVAAYVPQASQSGGPRVLGEVLLATFGWAASLALIGWGLSRFMRRHRPRAELVLRSVEGIARHRSAQSGGSDADILLVTIAGVELPVSREVERGFVSGQRYRVHYVESPNRVVLSAEPSGP